LIPVKRVHLAVAALGRLSRGSLVVVGDGPERLALEALGRARLPGRCHFAGAVPRAEIGAWYRAADVLAFPSSAVETGGLVLLEAMSCGTPVVATDDPTRRWLVGAGGRTVRVEDEGAFAAALGEVAVAGLQRAARA